MHGERAIPSAPGHVAGAEASSRVRAAGADPRLPVLLLGVLSLAAFALVLVLGRGMTFYFDEWNFVLERQGRSAAVFLKPHNEHISVVPVLVYKLLFASAGLERHWPYLAVLALMHVGVAAAVFVLAQRRVGPWVALIVAALLLFMGLAWQNIVWAFQIGFVGSVLGGVLALVALDTPSRRNDVLACAALVFSVVSSSLGVPLALGVGVELLVGRRARALWVALVPLALYGVWYLKYGISTITGDGLVHAVGWAVPAAQNAAGAPFGVGADWGLIILLIAIVAVGRRVVEGPPLTARFLNLAVAGIAFWLLTGAARSVMQPPVSPTQSRYLTLGAIIFLLGAVELLRGTAFPQRFVAYAAGIAAICVWIGYPELQHQAKTLRQSSERTVASLGALQLSPGPIDPNYQPDPFNPQILAGPYQAAVKHYNSDPAAGPTELRAASSAARSQADKVFKDLDVTVAAATGVAATAQPPALESTTGAAQPARRGCAAIQPQAAATTATLRVPPTGMLVRAPATGPAEVRVRRYADDFQAPAISTIPAGAAFVLRVKPDAAPQPYRAQLSAPGALTLCTPG